MLGPHFYSEDFGFLDKLNTEVSTSLLAALLNSFLNDIDDLKGVLTSRMWKEQHRYWLVFWWLNMRKEKREEVSLINKKITAWFENLYRKVMPLSLTTYKLLFNIPLSLSTDSMTQVGPWRPSTSISMNLYS
jgi:hypothetical protein